MLCLAVIVFIATAFKVGSARGKYGIKAPATSGHPDFERVFRVQQNTLEQLVAFIPSFVLFAQYVSANWAAGIGLVWIIGRIWFALGYYAAAEKRGPGFMITFFALVLLLGGAIVGIIANLLR
ncbi:MAG: MAPEG family protein [Proteobacteria bacterium]|nr:MAPEG family protein [Pseudomonadota bacterium]